MNIQQGNNENQSRLPSLQVVRGVLEAIIVAALLWTGSSLIQLKTQIAVAQVQLTAIQVTLAEVPDVKLEAVKQDSDIRQLKEMTAQNRADIAELRKLRGLR